MTRLCEKIISTPHGGGWGNQIMFLEFLLTQAKRLNYRPLLTEEGKAILLHLFPGLKVQTFQEAGCKMKRPGKCYKGMTI